MMDLVRIEHFRALKHVEVRLRPLTVLVGPSPPLDDPAPSVTARETRRFKTGRTSDRETAPPLPTALGCANPHAEAWLLDDAVAVRAALGLGADAAFTEDVRAEIGPLA